MNESCEWCFKDAVHAIEAEHSEGYRRYACDNKEHLDKIIRLAKLDHEEVELKHDYSGTGFQMQPKP